MNSFPEFRYAAFISYRHVNPDRQWAKWLHGELETFRVPAVLKNRGIPARIGRVFRDEEELAASADLSASIDEALSQSAYLIVICSPRTPESQWVNQEVVRFRELGRDNRILALLIEGEPADAFPRALREIRTTSEDNLPNTQLIQQELEPLAADVRPVPDESPRRAKRMAFMKLGATVLGCRFDDLRQRDQERRTRKLTYLALSLGALVAIVGALAIYARFEQRQAEHQARVATAQKLAAQARVHFDDRPDMAALLSVEASLRDDSPEVRAALLDQLEHNARLWTFLRGHTAPVRSVAFSPDGKRMASGGDDHSIRLWDAETWQSLGEFPDGHTGAVWSLAFSPDGSLLASGSADQTIRLWSVETREALGQPLLGHSGLVRSIVFFHDGKTLLSSSADDSNGLETLRWNLTAQPPTASPFGGQRGDSGSLALTPAGDLLVIGGGQGNMSLWDMESQRRLAAGRLTEGVLVPGLVLSPDGRTLAAVDDFAITRWDISGKSFKTKPLAGNKAFLRAVDIDAGGNVLAGGGNDAKVYLWDLGTGTQRTYPLVGHNGQISSLAFRPGGAELVTGSEDGNLIVWNPTPRSRIRHSLRQAGRTTAAAFSPADQLLVTGTADGDIRVWNLGSQPPSLQQSIAAGAWAYVLALAQDGQTVLACGKDQRLSAWDVKTGRPRGNPFPDLPCDDSTMLGSGGQTLARIECVYPTEWGCDSEQIATVWDLNDGHLIRRSSLVRQDEPMVAVALSQDGTRMASGTHAGRLWLWDLRTPKATYQELKPGHSASVAALTFSTDGRRVASGSDDLTIRIWNTETGQLERPPFETPGRVSGLAFGPSAASIAATNSSPLGKPSSLQVWDVATGTAIGAPMESEAASIGGVVAIGRTGNWIVTGSQTDDFILWDMNMENWRIQACRQANRNLSPTEEWPLYFGEQPYLYDKNTCPDLPPPVPIPRARHDVEEEAY